MKSQAHNFKGYDRYFILEELQTTRYQPTANRQCGQDTLFGIAQCQVHRP